MFGYGGLYVLDKSIYPISRIKINRDDNIYKIGFNEGNNEGVWKNYDSTFSFIDQELYEEKKMIKLADVFYIRDKMSDIMSENASKHNGKYVNILKKQEYVAKDVTKFIEMIVTGLGFGLATNILYNLVNCNSIYNQDLQEMRQCLTIISKYNI